MQSSRRHTEHCEHCSSYRAIVYSNATVCNMAYAAGVLVLAVHRGEVHVLLGKDHYNTYSDFGGKSDPEDNMNSARTAAREFYEETSGCIYGIDEAYSRLQNAPMIHTLSYTNKPYCMYVILDRYDESHPPTFSIVNNYLKSVRGMSKYLEKVSISWFKLSDVINTKVRLRNIFQRTIDKHKNTILKIASDYKSRNTHYING